MNTAKTSAIITLSTALLIMAALACTGVEPEPTPIPTLAPHRCAGSGNQPHGNRHGIAPRIPQRRRRRQLRPRFRQRRCQPTPRLQHLHRNPHQPPHRHRLQPARHGLLSLRAQPLRRRRRTRWPDCENADWLKRNAGWRANEIKALPWVSDGVGDSEREAAELLIAAARWYPDTFRALVGIAVGWRQHYPRRNSRHLRPTVGGAIQPRSPPS